VSAVTFDYAQRHAVEIKAARSMVEHLARHGIIVPHEVIPVGPLLAGTSPLVSGNAVEQYASAAHLPGGLEKTFVPMRNALFLVLAANRAATMFPLDAEPVDLITGVSQEDYGGYPDCREDFIDAVGHMIAAALDAPELQRVRVVAPLLHVNKRDTVILSERTAYGRALNALSHTCYNGAVPPCGTCHACLLRSKGYAEADVIDPLIERLGACSSDPTA
jgi:7-cyano-7-deazaguanine synthase